MPRAVGTGTGSGTGVHSWDYLHDFVEAQRLEGTGERHFFGLGAERMRNVYDWRGINEQLNVRAAQGWELISAEPHWIWANQTFGAPLWLAFADKSRRRVEGAVSHPEFIVGWYCTYRRPHVSGWKIETEFPDTPAETMQGISAVTPLWPVPGEIAPGFESAHLYGSTDETATEVGSLPRDASFEITDRQGDWYQVRTGPGDIGWVMVGVVRPRA